MKIYPKNQIYLILPEMTEGQDGWRVSETYISRKECEEFKQQFRGYERTVNRLQVSKLRKRIEELTDAR
jgi:hypothetical protein